MKKSLENMHREYDEELKKDSKSDPEQINDCPEYPERIDIVVNGKTKKCIYDASNIGSLKQVRFERVKANFKNDDHLARESELLYADQRIEQLNKEDQEERECNPHTTTEKCICIIKAREAYKAYKYWLKERSIPLEELDKPLKMTGSKLETLVNAIKDCFHSEDIKELTELLKGNGRNGCRIRFNGDSKQLVCLFYYTKKYGYFGPIKKKTITVWISNNFQFFKADRYTDCTYGTVDKTFNENLLPEEKDYKLIPKL